MFTDNKYVGREFSSIRDSIVEYIKGRTSEWTDFNESSIGMVYIEVLAGVADMLSYYLDAQALENFISSAKQPGNIRGLLEAYNYKLGSIGSARGNITFTRIPYTTEADPGAILIPEYTNVQTLLKPIKNYVTLNRAYLTEEALTADIPSVEGTMYQLKVSVGQLKKSYKYYISENPIPLDLVFVEQSSGQWERVEDAFLEIDGGMKYSVHLDSDNRVYLYFTWNYKNYLPDLDSEEITIKYLQSSGTAGIAKPFELDQIVGRLYSVSGDDCTKHVYCTNNQGTVGAFDQPDLLVAKANARNYIKTMGRCVTLEDSVS